MQFHQSVRLLHDFNNCFVFVFAFLHHSYCSWDKVQIFHNQMHAHRTDVIELVGGGGGVDHIRAADFYKQKQNRFSSQFIFYLVFRLYVCVFVRINTSCSRIQERNGNV